LCTYSDESLSDLLLKQTAKSGNRIPGNVNKDLALKAKAKTSDHNFVLRDNQSQGQHPCLLVTLMDDSSVVWKYIRPVDSVRAAVADQGQGQGLELQGQGQARTRDHNLVLKDNQGLTKAKDNIPAEFTQWAL